MCGRYYSRRDKQEIAERMHVKKVFAEPHPPNYNIAPSTFQRVIRQERDSHEREMVLMRWGLVPSFAKTLAEWKGMSTINAKAETIQTSATWRVPFKKHRCIIPADGFYEWKMLDSHKYPKKQPYAITLRSGEPLALAGIWDAWKEPKPSKGSLHTPDSWLQSFSIITTEANELISVLHTRMPVILREREWTRWLDRELTEQPPIDLLRPHDSDEMQMEPCNPLVGNVRQNGPEMLVCPNSNEPLSLLNSA
jgi:putative SOS response-associated peptidase YedK